MPYFTYFMWLFLLSTVTNFLSHKSHGTIFLDGDISLPLHAAPAEWTIISPVINSTIITRMHMRSCDLSLTCNLWRAIGLCRFVWCGFEDDLTILSDRCSGSSSSRRLRLLPMNDWEGDRHRLLPRNGCGDGFGVLGESSSISLYFHRLVCRFRRLGTLDPACIAKYVLITVRISIVGTSNRTISFTLAVGWTEWYWRL